jgi:hypothetical protein
VSENEDVEVSPKGVILKGAYSDLRPAIQRSVQVAETVLSVIDNLVGLPADFLNHHLTTFRDRYRQRIEEIPAAQRDVPPLRIGCSVLKEVAFAAEEPEIQKMFADLLGTSSDTETQHLAHPGFADVINQLLPLDAKLLRALIDLKQPYPRSVSLSSISQHFNPHQDEHKTAQLRTSIDNLVRLGLLEWDVKGVSWHVARGLKPFRHRHTRISSFSQDVAREVRDIKDAVTDIDRTFNEFSDKVSRVLENVGEKEALRSTGFGRQFVAACLRNGESIPEDVAS